MYLSFVCVTFIIEKYEFSYDTVRLIKKKNYEKSCFYSSLLADFNLLIEEEKSNSNESSNTVTQLNTAYFSFNCACIKLKRWIHDRVRKPNLLCGTDVFFVIVWIFFLLFLFFWFVVWRSLISLLAIYFIFCHHKLIRVSLAVLCIFHLPRKLHLIILMLAFLLLLCVKSICQLLKCTSFYCCKIR